MELIVEDGSLSASNLQISISHSPLPHRAALPRIFHPQIQGFHRRYPRTHASTRGVHCAHRGIPVVYRIGWHDFVHVVKDQCDAPRAASRLTARPGISCIERITTLIVAMEANEDGKAYQIVFLRVTTSSSLPEDGPLSRCHSGWSFHILSHCKTRCH